MKFNTYHRDDNRWSRVQNWEKSQGVTFNVFNVFMDILYKYKDVIPNIRNINTFIEMFIVLFFIPFYLFGNILLYSSVKEVDTASHLLDEIDNLNIKRRAYGIEAE